MKCKSFAHFGRLTEILREFSSPRHINIMIKPNVFDFISTFIMAGFQMLEQESRNEFMTKRNKISLTDLSFVP